MKSREKKRNEVLKKLYESLIEGGLKITTLQKKMGMSRTNLNHYIEQFEGEGYLLKKQIKNLQGKPVLISMTNNLIELHNKGFDENEKTKEFVFEILKQIKQKGSLSKEEFVDCLEYGEPFEKIRRKVIMTLPFYHPPLIEMRYFLTAEGEKFVKEKEKDVD